MKLFGHIIVGHTKPCGRCPFWRRSIPGAAQASMASFARTALQATQQGSPLLCYKSKPDDNPLLWCAGQLIFMKNAAINDLIQDPRVGLALQKVTTDHSVFSYPQEYICHHSHGDDE